MASLLLLLFLLLPAASAVTDPGDLAVLEDLRRGLLNADLLEWPAGDTDPCGSHWPHLVCSGQRVTQIQVQGLGLAGPLPATLGRLTMLTNLGLQRNNLSGGLPSLRGLASLQYAFLGNNHFESIPADFFSGLASLRVLSLDYNPLNHTSGWSLPAALADCPQLVNFSCSECNIVGPLPGELAGLPQLSSLRLAYNSLTGPLPPQLAGSGLQALVLNNQYGDGMSGPIHVLAAMPSLVTVWLHGNSFSGTIPENISACASLAYLVLNNNRLTGTVPAAALRQLPQLQILNLNNNLFLGPVPDLKIQNYSYSWNSFCRDAPGLPCSPVVTALLAFLSGVGYSRQLAESWAGNDPCSSWLGVSCDSSGNVTVLNLPSNSLSGTLSPSLGSIPSLATIMLGGNNLSGTIPASFTKLTSLRLLNLSSNNLQPPIPSFPASVKLLLDSNPYIQNPNLLPPSPSAVNSSNPPSDDGATPPRTPSNSRTPMPNSNPLPVAKSSSITKVVAAVGSVAALLLIALLIILRVRLRKISKSRSVTPGSVVVHPRDSSAFSGNTVKITVAETPSKSIAGSGIQSVGSIATTDTHMFNSGNLLVSVQVLRDVTRNFHPENVVGRGGFGVVYRGELHDGTAIAVKRMEAAVISNKALDEFQSEIAVLSKVRHRNLVSLLGYSIEGSERLLVYEYMPEGALSKHLFHWKELGMEPLSWKRRLNIALDVARGMEYLHNLAHQSFIHRDLKSSNILLDDDFRAKVADFGLVKLAPDGRNSVATRLAGTFGYLAPEYAVTGKITTKADVFSYGVVLMELLTGMAALDEDRPEESRYLASWFFDVKSKREKFKNAIDNSIDLTEETFESICTIAELAGHCAAREPHQRPDMGHAVNVLSPLVEKWKPMKDDQEEFLGIDLHQPLLQMVKGWQADDCSNMTSLSLDDSKGSIPARPTGFAESFTSADGR